MNTISPAAYEGDIVSRLRNWRGLHLAHSGELFEEAAGKIEKLRRRLRLADAALQSIGHNETDSPQAVASTPAPHATPDEGTAHGGCIVRRLRQTRADMIGTNDESHYFDCHEAASEIERLRRWGRLTDDERRAVREAADAYEQNNDDADCERIAAALRGVLERL